jgi:hypothetical protein
MLQSRRTGSINGLLLFCWNQTGMRNNHVSKSCDTSHLSFVTRDMKAAGSIGVLLQFMIMRTETAGTDWIAAIRRLAALIVPGMRSPHEQCQVRKDEG